MAAGTLPEPGTEIGPCTGGCNHEDCALTVEMAATLCGICDRAIGYGIRFFQRVYVASDNDHVVIAGGRVTLVHELCAMSERATSAFNEETTQ